MATEAINRKSDNCYLKVIATKGCLNIEMRGVKRVVIYPKSGQQPYGGSIKVEDPALTAWMEGYRNYRRKYGRRKARNEYPDYVPSDEVLTFTIYRYDGKKNAVQRLMRKKVEHWMSGDWEAWGISNKSNYIDMPCKIVTIP